MIAMRTVDVRDDFKKVSDMVIAGEKVLITRPRNKNLVVMSEDEYNALERARSNAEYLNKLDRSIRQIAEGRVVVKTMAELESMASE